MPGITQVEALAPIGRYRVVANGRCDAGHRLFFTGGADGVKVEEAGTVPN
jgi:hypothetical protein